MTRLNEIMFSVSDTDKCWTLTRVGHERLWIEVLMLQRGNIFYF